MKKFITRLFSLASGALSLFSLLIIFVGSISNSDKPGATGAIIILSIFVVFFALISYSLWTLTSPKTVLSKLLRFKKRQKPFLPETSLYEDDNSENIEQYKPQVVAFDEQTQESGDELETLTERRVKALYKLASQILDDDEVDLEEAKKLRSWLRRYPESKDDYRTQKLYLTAESVLEDRKLDKNESLELFALLSEFCDQYEEESEEITQAVFEAERLLIQANEIIQQHKEEKKKKPVKKLDFDGYSFLKQLESGNDYFLEYEDSKGQITERKIIFRSLDTNQSNEPYIKAVCTLRNKIRTFRVDRIQSLVDLDTGEAFV